jgi:hypothetical protein
VPHPASAVTRTTVPMVVLPDTIERIVLHNMLFSRSIAPAIGSTLEGRTP